MNGYVLYIYAQFNSEPFVEMVNVPLFLHA